MDGVTGHNLTGNNMDMVCEACKDRRHDDCRGGSWCDCQHQGFRVEDEAEPPENWVRQG